MNIPDLLEGLHCCSMNVNTRDCEFCPYVNKYCCMDSLLEHAEDALVQLSEPKWISVKENPPGLGFVLIYVAPYAAVDIAKYKGGLWRTKDRKVLMPEWVTHWMPLPETPKEE